MIQRSRGIGRRVTMALLPVALLAGSAASPTQAREALEPGASGIGDPYFPLSGNGGYRVSQYDIDVAYQPATGRLTGTTTITAKAIQNLSQFHLDFLLNTKAVTVNGVPAAHEQRRRRELVIMPASRIAKGDVMRVKVSYTGMPRNVRLGAIGGWFSGHGGASALALGEPQVAVLWYPSNDHPRDKAKFDITVRVPRGFEAISNGKLKGVGQQGRRSVWRWHVGSPMATYLAFLAIGQYEVERGRTPSGMPYLNAFSTRLGSYERPAKRSVRRTPSVVEWESGIFGPYPFHQIGGVVPPFRVGFALENQTRPVYSKLFFGGTNMYVIVHEIAHQWFGDSVSVKNWKHIWLNEGFATHAEWLWSRHTGSLRPNQVFRLLYREFGRNDDFWKLEVGDPGPRHLFDSPIYIRGAMTLQAIHNVVGEPTFRKILAAWAKVKAGKNGTTAQFRRLAERLSGSDLRHVFKVWLHTTTKPAATKANGYPVRGKQLNLTSSERSRVVEMVERTHRLARIEGR